MTSYWDLRTAANASEIADHLRYLREEAELNRPEVRDFDKLVKSYITRALTFQEDTESHIKTFVSAAEMVQLDGLITSNYRECLERIIPPINANTKVDEWSSTITALYLLVYPALGDKQMFDTMKIWHFVIKCILMEREGDYPKRLVDTGDCLTALEITEGRRKVCQLLMQQIMEKSKDFDRLQEHGESHDLIFSTQEDGNTLKQPIILDELFDSWGALRTKHSAMLTMCFIQAVQPSAHLESIKSRTDRLIKDCDIFAASFLNYTRSSHINSILEALLLKTLAKIQPELTKEHMHHILNSTEPPQQTEEPASKKKEGTEEMESHIVPQMSLDPSAVSTHSKSATEPNHRHGEASASIAKAIDKASELGLCHASTIDPIRCEVDQVNPSMVRLYNYIGMFVCTVGLQE
jgi:hypothetical protein